MDWDYRGSLPEATDSVASFQAWFKALDDELVEALSALFRRGLAQAPG
jgi:hypothetical protein